MTYLHLGTGKIVLEESLKRDYIESFKKGNVDNQSFNSWLYDLGYVDTEVFDRDIKDVFTNLKTTMMELEGTVAKYNLAEILENSFNLEYPFDKDLTEIVYDVSEWCDMINRCIDDM